MENWPRQISHGESRSLNGAIVLFSSHALTGRPRLVVKNMPFVPETVGWRMESHCSWITRREAKNGGVLQSCPLCSMICPFDDQIPYRPVKSNVS